MRSAHCVLKRIRKPECRPNGPSRENFKAGPLSAVQSEIRYERYLEEYTVTRDQIAVGKVHRGSACSALATPHEVAYAPFISGSKLFADGTAEEAKAPPTRLALDAGGWGSATSLDMTVVSIPSDRTPSHTLTILC